MKKEYENYAKIILSLLSMVFLIYIGSVGLKKVKLDMTEEGIFTLSEGSINVMQKIDSSITLKLYYSKTAANKGTEGLRQFNNYYLYVRDLLEEYRSYSRNNLKIEVIDPRPDTEDEEDATGYGLKKFNLSETEKYFFGLVAENEAGSEKVIEFFDPAQKDKLEYNITKLILSVLSPTKKQIGIISSTEVIVPDMPEYMAQIMRMQGKEVNNSWTIVSQLKEFYNVTKVENTATEISKNLKVLIVVHPRGFSEETLFAIDQYLIGGGKLVVFIDPNAVTIPPEGKMMTMSHSPDAGFQKLMDRWGIGISENTFVGDKNLAGSGRSSADMPVMKMLALMNCDSRCTEAYKDPISSGLNQTMFVFPGALEVNAAQGITYTPLLSTTDKGNTYRTSPYEMGNAAALWSKFEEGSKPQILGYRLVGKFRSAFPDGLNKSTVEQKDKDEKIKTEKTLRMNQNETAIVVFSDVDFIHDQFAYRNTFLGKAAANQNSTLVLNALEVVSGDQDLISVRSKGMINRSFDVIREIELEADKRTQNKVSEINASIAKTQAEINKLGQEANAGNVAILRNQSISKRKQLAKRVAMLKKELREVKRIGREKIEVIGKRLMYLNTLLVPVLIVIFGFIYFRLRQAGKKHLKSYDSVTEEQKA